ncbi:MAG: nucleotidyl transferase AbiEii/AbiGii toxin family protein [Betaproteobacteria bacterium]|nr:nucleotidyl transferase AbiEii/AbiGii toxin family protein [Betaproteobacteria bacterium]
MHEAVAAMMARYNCRTAIDYTNALREIMQEIVLLGLWRSKFFEAAAFYGGTSLRVLHGLDRYSEDMDFSLLAATPDFDLGAYGRALERELQAFGFTVSVQRKEKARPSAVQSAFLKADTYREVLVVATDEEIVKAIPRGRLLKIRLEVDTDPPGGFATESRFLLQPIPFSVRTFTPPCLFAGKMHAVLCRQWRSRVKGRDWYDFVWFVARGIPLDLAHLATRMRQSGHLASDSVLSEDLFRERLLQRTHALKVASARQDVAPFVKDADATAVWSQEFFCEVGSRVRVVGVDRTPGE